MTRIRWKPSRQKGQPRRYAHFVSSPTIRERNRAARLRNKTTYTPSQKLKACEICGEVKPSNKDHDHTTGGVRGFLCMGCNVSLGRFNDDPVLLEKAVAYLRKYQASTSVYLTK